MKHVKKARLKINPCEIVNRLRAFSLKIYGQFLRSLAQIARRHGMSALWFALKHLFFGASSAEGTLWTQFPLTKTKKFEKKVKWRNSYPFISSLEEVRTPSCENWCCQKPFFFHPFNMKLFLCDVLFSFRCSLLFFLSFWKTSSRESRKCFLSTGKSRNLRIRKACDENPFLQ